MLRIEGLRCAYGDLEAVHGISMSVAAGGVHALLGPNGAGKTSTIMAIAGHVPVTGGKIDYLGEDLSAIAITRRVERGLALVPEGRRLFPDLSVAENLDIGGYVHCLSDNEKSRERVFALFPRLRERSSQRAGSLSGGEQQMLAIGRALMSQPRLLMIDELSLGLMPRIIDDIYRVIGDLKAEGLTILLVEQNTQRALEVADSVCVLESGRVVWQGDAGAARGNPDLFESYLGVPV